MEKKWSEKRIRWKATGTEDWIREEDFLKIEKFVTERRKRREKEKEKHEKPVRMIRKKKENETNEMRGGR